MQQRTPSDLKQWDRFVIPERQKPKLDRPIPKGTVVDVVATWPTPVGIVRVLVLTPWGRVRTLLFPEEMLLDIA